MILLSPDTIALKQGQAPVTDGPCKGCRFYLPPLDRWRSEPTSTPLCGASTQWRDVLSEGTCTRNPQWEQVMEYHFCGEFKENKT